MKRQLGPKAQVYYSSTCVLVQVPLLKPVGVHGSARCWALAPLSLEITDRPPFYFRGNETGSHNSGDKLQAFKKKKSQIQLLDFMCAQR